MATWLLRSVACRGRRWVWKSRGVGSAWLCLREAASSHGVWYFVPGLRCPASRVAIPVLFSCWENLRIWWGIFQGGGVGPPAPSSSLVLGPESLGRTIPHSEARGLVAPGFWVYLCWDRQHGGEGRPWSERTRCY